MLLIAGASAAGVAAITKWGEASDFAAQIAADRSGTIDTPLGRADWVFLSGNTSTFPTSGTFITLPSGYAALEFTLSPEALRYWTSPDGLSWSQREVPMPPSDAPSLPKAGDGYWIAAHRPAGLWYSPNGMDRTSHA